MMRIATHILAYNVTELLPNVMRNAAAGAEKIYVARPLRPWKYVQESRDTKANPTTLEHIVGAANGLNIEVLEGDWETEEEMRNACLIRARADGFDWLLVQDADEYYDKNSWRQIHSFLERVSIFNHINTTWYNFWKSSEFVLANRAGDIKGTNACFAIRLDSNVQFRKARQTTAREAEISTLDVPCYHYGYVLTDAEVQEKISNWAHANDFDRQSWYEHKWLNWTPRTKYLHPTHPDAWFRAIRFPLHQPDFALLFLRPTTQRRRASILSFIRRLIYDVKIRAIGLIRNTKQGGPLANK